jgi:cell division protein FtsL
MQMKITFLCICILIVFFLHFFNENQIVKATKDNATLRKLYNAEKTINTELWIENNQLNSRDRIIQFASADLGMVCPKTDGSQVIYIKENETKDKIFFSLIDFISPEAQALTQK